MHPDRVIVRTYRHSDGISTRPNDQNTLTCQSSDTNNTPRDPLHGPVTLPRNINIKVMCSLVRTITMKVLRHQNDFM